ncbi:MAG: hypothetical protein IT285_05385 [Bdellovibrionales bacterium]|nr:hypothetical protein [Bdellovibrionales bacterium]
MSNLRLSLAQLLGHHLRSAVRSVLSAAAMLSLLAAPVFAGVVDPVAPGGPGTGPGLGSPLTGGIDTIKGTIGIVCVKNNGESVSWYPTAVDSAHRSAQLRRCFDEVSSNWNHLGSGGTHGDSGESMDAFTAYQSMIELMNDVARVAP